MSKHIKNPAKQLPESLRQQLIAARQKLGWTQKELGQRVGLPQMHISGIETGRVVPRYDTLLEIARVLQLDLVLVPRHLVPVVQSLVKDSFSPRPAGPESEDEPPLYTLDESAP